MVENRANPLAQRDYYASREPVSAWTNARISDRAFENITEPPRYSPAHSIHPRCLPIDTALKECVGLSETKEFALVTFQNNGECKMYTSHSLREFQTRIFSPRFKDNFQNIVRQVSIDGPFSNSVYNHDSGVFGNEYDGESSGRDFRKASISASDGSSSGSRQRRNARRTKDTSDEDGSGSNSRKRKWNYNRNADHEDDAPQPVLTIRTQQLMIGDDEEVHSFYITRLKDMQQSACKVMGKAFVKLIEPKKQTHHPYTKGDANRPPWWPPTTPTSHVRHKEPDHLLKPERITLLAHILEMVIKPYNSQHSTVQKLGLNVKKLEDATMEAMNNWFNDKEHPTNAAKKPFLKEIFKVARLQERYKADEIDGTTKVSVMSAEQMGNSSSDDEPDDGDAYDESDSPPGTIIHTPDSQISPTASMMQNIQPGPRPMDDLRAREMDIAGRQRQEWRQTQPQRYHSQPQGFGDQKMDEQNSPYQSDSFRSKWELNSGSSFHQPQSDSGHHGQYQPQQQQQQQSMYGGWQSNGIPIIGTSNGASQPFYVTSPQATADPRTYPLQLPPLGMAQQSMPPPPLAMNHSSYNENLSNGGNRYDTGPAMMGSQMRTGSLGHPYGSRDHGGSAGYSDFLGEPTGFNHVEDSLKVEQQHHLPPQ